MNQHRGESNTGPQSAVHLHLKATSRSFEDSDVQILARGKNWFKRRVKEAIFVKKENPSLNKNGDSDTIYLLFTTPSSNLKQNKQENNRCIQVRSRGVEAPLWT
ncbi:hypothetical protein NL108_007813 [Boleophthalmus pectinirostris]|nr:hypothetical protein NL108_007813 [Boleophthalmus pectinirostris]